MERGRRKGTPKTGGRQKGSKNKPERRSMLEEFKDKYPDLNPLNELASLYMLNKTRDVALAFNAIKELAKYTAPQLKAMDITDKTERPIPIINFVGKSTEELQQMLNEPDE